MLDKIPIRLNVQSSKVTVDEATGRFKASKVFYPKKLCGNYFSLVVNAILEDCSPIGIIQDYIPDIDGQIHVELVVADCAAQTRDDAIVFVYSSDMDEEAFETECTRVRSEILLRMRQRERTPYNILRSLTWASPVTVESANLQFVMGDYRNALVGYSSVVKQFPELSRRMCEICRVLLDERALLEPLAFDILLFVGRYSELYELSGILPFDAQLAVRYYLIGRDLGKKKRMIVLNQCYEGFLLAGNIEKGNQCRSELVRMVEVAASTEPWNESFWLEFLSVLTEAADNQ